MQREENVRTKVDRTTQGGRQTQTSETILKSPWIMHCALFIALCHKMLCKHSEEFSLYSLIVAFPIECSWDDFWIK